jgi:pyridinium-3,5-biscarboxylic acid mononucleotide sulfurtransferase
MQSAEQKLATLQHLLKDMGSIVLAYSGGVDSTFLLRVASEVLGDKIRAVTAVSPLYTREEHKIACTMASCFGVRHLAIQTNELENPDFCKNPPHRCYLCKKELFQALRTIADREDIAFIADASNKDDCSDFRPGRVAAEEVGVRSPLIEARLTKREIRALSKEMGLLTWDLPSMACLASRFPYGEVLTMEKIERVGEAERFLRGLGFSQVRVRSHDTIARIEVHANLAHKLTDIRLGWMVARRLKRLGFVYVTVDLEGYRTGSMNEVLPSKDQGVVRLGAKQRRFPRSAEHGKPK